MGANLKVREVKVTFRRKQSHDLNKLLKKLTAESEDAVEILVELMKSADEKIRMEAAKKLLDLQVQVANTINDDAFKRVLAEARFPSGVGQLTTDEDDTPQVNFNDIQDL